VTGRNVQQRHLQQFAIVIVIIIIITTIPV